MLVQAQDEVSEAQITVISESQSSNSLMTPREQMTSSKSHFKALSTGISDIGAASMVFTVESSEISTQSEVRGIAISSKKSQRSELVPVRLYPTRTRTPDKPTQPVNPYERHDYEYINEVLHGIYPTNWEGIIVRDHFDIKAALVDVENLYALKKGSVVDDELNILTGLWAKKIQYAIDKQNDSDNVFSDEEESD